MPWTTERRGEGKPKTFDFLGFTHICGTTRKTGRFIVKRQTIRRRFSAKLAVIKEALRRRWHEPVPMTGRWLNAVVRGYFNDHAVPGNMDSLNSFRTQVIGRWYRALRRRGQRRRLTWARFLRRRCLDSQRPHSASTPERAPSTLCIQGRSRMQQF